MTDHNDSFLRDVENALTEEKYQQLWERYGTFIIVGVAALVLGVGGYQYYKSSSLAAAQAAGASYANAQQESGGDKSSIGARVAAANAFKDLAKGGPSGYASLAQLQLAGARMEAGKTDEALKLFEELAQRSGVDPLLRDFAVLQAATLRLGKADFTEIQNRLTPLAGDDSAWRISARQLLGIAAAQAGKNDEARSYFERLLADADAPSGVRQRANLYMTKLALVDKATGSAAAEKDKGTETSAKDENKTGDQAPAASSENKEKSGEDNKK